MLQGDYFYPPWSSGGIKRQSMTWFFPTFPFLLYSFSFYVSFRLQLCMLHTHWWIGGKYVVGFDLSKLHQLIQKEK